MTDRTLSRIQAASGLLFAAFLTFHLLNTAVAPAGQATYDGYQRAARRAYQLPPVEIALVLGAATLHIASGLVRIWRRRRAAAPRPPLRMRLHRWTGYVLLLFIGGHVAATRGPPLLFDTPVDFSFLSFSLEHWPWAFYGYYALFGASGAYHLLSGVLLALPMLGARLPATLQRPGSRPFWAAVVLAVAAICAGIFALGGGLYELDRGRYPEYRRLYERWLPPAVLPWEPAR